MKIDLTRFWMSDWVCGGRGLAFGAAILIFFVGCSEQLDYRIGIVTRSITGRLLINNDLKDVQPFIVVRKYNKTLIETSAGYLHRVSAAIIYPENGKYTVEMAAEVDQVKLTFLGRYHRPLTFRFNRTLGVSQYIYDAQLKVDPLWRDSYFLLIKPNLTEYIVEQRFKMEKADQFFLGQWMDRTKMSSIRSQRISSRFDINRACGFVSKDRRR